MGNACGKRGEEEETLSSSLDFEDTAVETRSYSSCSSESTSLSSSWVGAVLSPKDELEVSSSYSSDAPRLAAKLHDIEIKLQRLQMGIENSLQQRDRRIEAQMGDLEERVSIAGSLRLPTLDMVDQTAKENNKGRKNKKSKSKKKGKKEESSSSEPNWKVDSLMSISEDSEAFTSSGRGGKGKGKRKGKGGSLEVRHMKHGAFVHLLDNWTGSRVLLTRKEGKAILAASGVKKRAFARVYAYYDDAHTVALWAFFSDDEELLFVIERKARKGKDDADQAGNVQYEALVKKGKRKGKRSKRSGAPGAPVCEYAAEVDHVQNPNHHLLSFRTSRTRHDPALYISSSSSLDS